ncbi:protein of unknown function [Pseudorhizobium banfieldiae]|uniref:Uncharacterized protein n=1 Tax=Pseudorhizobium banfieldiae TaxID=1125847 RepID=L0NE48_9HYPH|nr:protein of unknown function [Pseudorhizobium banfieldiae]
MVTGSLPTGHGEERFPTGAARNAGDCIPQMLRIVSSPLNVNYRQCATVSELKAVVAGDR